jgi:hypothetical protein
MAGDKMGFAALYPSYAVDVRYLTKTPECR